MKEVIFNRDIITDRKYRKGDTVSVSEDRANYWLKLGIVRLADEVKRPDLSWLHSLNCTGEHEVTDNSAPHFMPKKEGNPIIQKRKYTKRK